HLGPATNTFQQGGRHSLSATTEHPPSWELSLKTRDGGQGTTPTLLTKCPASLPSPPPGETPRQASGVERPPARPHLQSAVRKLRPSPPRPVGSFSAGPPGGKAGSGEPPGRRNDGTAYWAAGTSKEKPGGGKPLG
ncbi:hypothetical protein MC885_017049, partial [Smutsia gigantea]